ncbi:UNVERIFIED_ORG: phosphoglycerate dehydrogenase-like enzyme [Arthrobacter globiformis]|nr:phosphoglycerate dehydrogenase-like enzyme [Arthrobacter globiformis]
MTGNMLTDAARLKVLGRSGVGYESIDVPAATAMGIRVRNARGQTTTPSPS